MIKRCFSFLLVLLFIVSCGYKSVRERAIKYNNRYAWEGPTTQAFTSFVRSYYRTPESTEELILHIQRVMDSSSEDVFFGDGRYIIEDLKQNPNHFVSYTDSCFFYSKNYNGMREGIRAYSPQYMLGRLSFMTAEERVVFESLLSPAFLGEDGLCILGGAEITFSDSLEKGLRGITDAYSSRIVRYDISPPVRLNTIFHYIKDEGLSYQRVVISSNSIKSYDLQNEQLSDISQDYYKECDGYVKGLSDYLELFIMKYPRIQEIYFYGPLCY